MEESLYSILGVPMHAKQNDIKKAYRTLSYQFHPDKNTGDAEKTEKYKQINEAYDVLKDNHKRKQYDYQILLDSGGMTPMGDIGNILGDLFNGMNSSNTMNEFMFMPFTQGMNFSHTSTMEDLHQTQEITLLQAYEGICVPINIKRQVIQNTEVFEETELIYVDIPKGVDHNEIITIDKKGNKYINKDTNLKLHIHIVPHATFKRDGLNLIYTHRLTFKESFLGFSFEFEHLNKKNIKLTNPKGRVILNKMEKSIDKLGFMRDEKVGNLILRFQVNTPEELNETQIKAIEEHF
jgi:DnaJ-class molecular chaperone